MRRLLSLFTAFTTSALLHFTARAQENGGVQELRDLRQAVQQQSQKIDSLAEQVGRLTRALDSSKAPEPVPPPPPAEAPKPPADSMPETPRGEGAPKVDFAIKGEAVPKAEAVAKPEPAGTGAKHVVAKGETLTSIAKQYNIPIAELKNTNKIENERKLQIGQILAVPTAKSPETPDKKENP